MDDDRRGMMGDVSSVEGGVDQRHDLHLERQLLLVALGAGIAGRGRIQFDVLNAHVGKSVFKVRHESAQLMEVSGAAEIEGRRAVRKFGKQADF